MSLSLFPPQSEAQLKAVSTGMVWTRGGRMDPGVSVEVTEATGDIVPVGLAVLTPGVGEHVDVVQGVWTSCTQM